MSALDYLQHKATNAGASLQSIGTSLQLADTPEAWVVENPGVSESARFGAIDTSLVVAGAMLGAALDPHIAKVTKASGYGPILGAVLANTLAAVIGAGGQGWRPAVGVTLGSAVALVPVAGALVLGKDAKGGAARVLLGSAALIIGAAYVSRQRRQSAA